MIDRKQKLPKPLPSVETLNECFDLNADIGILRWKVRPPHHFDSARVMKLWNTRYAGEIVGVLCNGYMLTRLFNIQYRIHRIIFFMEHGQQPVCIDHIDGDRKNNRISNLRAATHQQNSSNLVLSKKNTSGFRGVTWDHELQSWKAQCMKNYKMYYLGNFDDIEEAGAAAKLARQKLHGEFA